MIRRTRRGLAPGRDDEFDEVAPLIANVHVKDQSTRRAERRPTWVAPGEGMVDYRAHFAALQRINYAGPVSLEPHMDGSLATIQKCKQAAEQLWTAVSNSSGFVI